MMPETEAALDARLDLLRKKADLLRTEKFRLFKPYVPQVEFFALSNTKREILFMAGNQCGKTVAGAYMMTCHLTGLYPDWWPGKRFPHPIKAWVGGDGGKNLRDKIQHELCGGLPDTAEFGTGLIYKRLIAGKLAGHGESGLLDSLRVRHVSGGVSSLAFKTYDQGRAKWQSDTLDVVWVDEEPPDDVYGEASTRLTGPGFIYTTCTPLQGSTQFIRRFTNPDTLDAARIRGVARMGLRHAEHFTEQQKADRLAGYPAHERAARENGDPVLEGGAIFSTPGEDLKIQVGARFLEQIPRHWRLIWGIDFGFTHPFAAALCAWDADAETFYVLRVLRMRGAVPVIHANAMKQIGANVPVAWPHDGTHTEKGSGEKLADIYRARECGLNMLKKHATHEHAGGYEVWPGLTEMDVAMRAGKFKVAATCYEFFEEYGTYRVDENGRIVKLDDDVLDAVRCAWMMRRRAQMVALGGTRVHPGSKVRRLDGADDEHFGIEPPDYVAPQRDPTTGRTIRPERDRQAVIRRIRGY
jgi:phage terminase large subunit-like protein